jgi:hypothetical protein
MKGRHLTRLTDPARAIRDVRSHKQHRRPYTADVSIG